MSFYLAVWAIGFINIFEINCFFIQESYKVQLEDNSNYKIEESFQEDDYELIDSDDLTKFKIKDKSIELDRLKILANREFKKDMETIGLVKEWFKGTEPIDPVVTNENQEIVTEFMKPLTQYVNRKREINNNRSEQTTDYEYKSLIDDYYEEEVEESKSNKSFHATTAGAPENELVHAAKEIIDFSGEARNCTVEETRRIGLKALKCVYKDYKMGNQRPRILAKRLLRIAKIWFFVYLFVAIPLWCSRGWCCCCLFCRFFKPRTTIEEAKRYLVTNPPGVLRHVRGTETQYKPTEYEIESYDKFEHIIRTI